jgi:hypothetical protein
MWCCGVGCWRAAWCWLGVAGWRLGFRGDPG